MAYVLWRVLMKKYSKVRMGIRTHPVIPADCRVPEKDEAGILTTEQSNECCDPSLSLSSDEPSTDVVHKIVAEDSEPEVPVSTTETNLQRVQETRKSKTRRVKSYLKKCKGALTSKTEESGSVGRHERNANCTSWYVEKQTVEPARENQQEQPLDEPRRDSPVVDNHFENSDECTEDETIVKSTENVIAAVIETRYDIISDNDEIKHLSSRETLLSIEDSRLVNKCDSSDTLIAESSVFPELGESIVVPLINYYNDNENISGGPSFAVISTGRGAVASLVRTHLGPIYGDEFLGLLTRQARDILVCTYHGNLENFFKLYLSPAAELLGRVKTAALEKRNDCTIPDGWPLTLAGKGLIVQLGELEQSILRHGECYLCVRKTPDQRSIGCTTNSRAIEEVNTDYPQIGDRALSDHLVEIAVVWRSSMRSPGILGWDREDEFMDWRDPTRKPTAQSESSGARPARETTSSGQRTETKSKLRRKSREESGRCRSPGNSQDRDIVGSKPVCPLNERLQYPASHWENVRPEDVGKHSKTTDSMNKKILKNSRDDNSTINVNLCLVEDRTTKNLSKIVGAKIMSIDLEKLKEANPSVSSGTCDCSSKRLNIDDLESPGTFETAINEKSGVDGGDNGSAGDGVCVDGCAGTATMYNCWTKSSSASSGFYSTTSGENESETSTSSVSHSVEALLIRDEINEKDNENDDRLTDLIESLLVTVQRKIERVNIEDLVFPCPACRNIDAEDSLLGCKCAIEQCGCDVVGEERCNCGNLSNSAWRTNETRSFEIAGIKHIDSDDEEEVRMGFGTKRRAEQVSTPRSIHDLSDDILNCGLKLPGYTDSAGRPVLEFEPGLANRREILCPREIAAYILYLVRLRSKDRTKDDWTLLVNGGNTEDLEIIDRALVLLGEKLSVHRVLVLRSARSEGLTEPQFPKSRVKTLNVDDVTIDQHIPRRRDEIHDQPRWIAFYKEYDNLMTEWQAAGRRLALEMSELKESSTTAGSLTPLSRLLMDSTLRRTSRDATEAISLLEGRAASLHHLDYVSLSLTRARKLFTEVSSAATRLETSLESRRATIRNLAMLRSIEDQAREVLNWLCKKGEEILVKQSQHAATTLTAARLDEREFEKFYFTSMRHLDKGSDLAEAASANGLRELARSLKQHLRGFGSRLEDRREYLEDTSRCCLLQDRAYDWAHEARMAGERRSQKFLMARPPLPAEHFTEMMGLAEKLGNDVLLEQCRLARNKCAEALEFARTASAPGSPARRRSFAASESAISWEDGLGKRTSWEDSDSNASYPCPMDAMGNSSNGSGRPTLDNIAELGESAEQLLDCSPPRTPPQSPAPRRLAKPPVNSHLHRAPSIAPGMKAKKTILLIMREMIQTERDYVKSLEYIIENYIPELVREDIPQALRGQRNVIFGNVEKIYEFHSQHFLRELEECEQCPMMVGQCFLRHEKKFYLYALYNKNKPNSDSLMAEYGTSFFKTKQLELGDKMDLASYLLKPVQRMGKYALLLQQLVKAGTDLSEQLIEKEDKEEREDEGKPIVEGEADLRAAEQMVRFQLRHGNDLLAMDSLRDCDVNVKEQGRLLRQNEFLVWQGKGKKCLRQVFLFEDLILFSKARRFPDRKNLDIYIYKHSIKTTDIGLTAVIADSPTKFEIWFRKRKPGDTYTLQCTSEDIKKAWTEELSNLLWKQALRNREVRLAEMSSMGIGNKPCLDIRPSADQINDRSISVAQLSKTPRFRNSIAVSISDDSGRCSRRPHSVISVSSSSSSGGSSGPPTTLNLGLDTSPRPHHRSTTLNSQCSVESGIIADISIISDDGGDGTERNHWKSTLESPTSHIPTTSTPLQSPTSENATPIGNVSTSSLSDANLSPYDQDMSINL